MRTVYLDNAATTPIKKEVINKITSSMEQLYANASATYAIGRKAKASLEASRKQIALSIGVNASEIVFTSGGTEANNLILNTAVKDLEVRHIITSKIEHHAVLKTIDSLKESYSIKVTYLPVLPSGDICIHTLEKVLSTSIDKVLVSLMHINNEIGAIIDLDQVGKLCENFKAFFHTDTVQTIGHLPLNLNKSKVHFATASAHKFYGPKGIGFAVIKNNLGAKSLFYGGEQERGLRPGTEAIHQISGMAEALKLCDENREGDSKYISEIKEYAVSSLKNKIEGVCFNGESEKIERKHTILNVCLPITNEKASIILFQLDMAGICCSRGSACQSGSNKPSHVLAEFLTAEKLALSSLRFSFSVYTTKEDIDYLIENLIKILAK